jgi:hypothetical protein
MLVSLRIPERSVGCVGALIYVVVKACSVVFLERVDARRESSLQVSWQLVPRDVISHPPNGSHAELRGAGFSKLHQGLQPRASVRRLVGSCV